MTPATTTAARQTTSLSILQRLEEEIAHKEILLEILLFCRRSHTVGEIEDHIISFSASQVSLHPPKRLISWMHDLGGIEKLTETNTTAERYRTNDAGENVCEALAPASQLRTLLSSEKLYDRIFTHILKSCVESKSREELEAIIENHPDFTETKLLPSYFIDKLEASRCIEWSGRWQTTYDGTTEYSSNRKKGGPPLSPSRQEKANFFTSSLTTVATESDSPPDTSTKIIKTNCRSCTADCGVLAHVKNNRVIKLEGNPEFERSEGTLCVKGLSGIHALYNPNRLKYPMQRVGARGENKWKRITWQEAIDKVARKLMEIREKYGAETVLASTGGGGNPNFYSTARFCNAFDTPNWFEPGAAQCYLPRMLLYGMTYGGGPLGNNSLGDSNCLEAYFYNDTKMKSFIIWGAAPSCSGPSQAGRVLVELRARGVKTVVIDPRFTPDASKADVWLPIRPGTDVALALCWIRAIIKRELYDRNFVMRWTNLPYLVNTKTKMHLRESDLVEGGSPDTFVVWDINTNSAKPMHYPYSEELAPALGGTFTVGTVQCKTGFELLQERVEPWTVTKTAEVCWLKKDMIEKALTIYTQDTPSSISLGVATDQTPNSTQAAHATAILDILLGNIEKPGTVLQRYDDNSVGRELRTSALTHFLSENQLQKRLGGTEHKGLLHWWTANPSAILQSITEGKPYKLRAWIERSGNKLGTVANAGAWVDGMKKMDLIVHFFMYPTSFSAYADFILPACEWLETDFPVNSFNRMYARQKTTHLFESANETWFWARLAERLAELGHEGCKRAFDAKETAPELPYFSSYEQELDAWAAKFEMTWDEFKEKTPFEFNPQDKWRRYYVYKEIDPQTKLPKGFNTPSQKCEVYLESLITLGRTGHPWTKMKLEPAEKDYDPLPYYLEPVESPNNEVGKEFPLVMTGGRLPYYHHTTLRNVPYLREIAPVAEVWIHPGDAQKYNVDHGDWLWVESKRGRTNAKARLTKEIAEGVVYMERFWNPETLTTSTFGYREMNVNLLSKSSAPHNDVCGTYTLRGYQVKVYKASGPPKGILQKPEDFKPWMPQPTNPTPVPEV